ncbi:DNA mismatch repair protein MutL [Pullulanibacillus pueri]|uniref:DNA mismatch repair protein MutL n=1 Tax=Pullulanibacillus pueri TaxID=1437324 RepID=A0A8J3EPJ0_9BACL|nr:DNA mismatch repair endonuclease MutL [Pullulanibacillus pueri]MBM7684139.1 DNA mismatch repair protein MutL [Pullulanibacillus pueri]GGH88776.1 DNA mismatch repair protein MutL [Pullulanibacillus pueri]
MGRIHRMSEPLANKIAAGEVVERPASIVKELVENAIDAAAKKILVEVKEGGLESIKITDDGHGFEPDDCEIAFERHATSKITDEPDLFHIRTLGFRGEALPSIASVSHIEMRTATEKGEGRRLVLHGGQIVESSSAHGRRGTEITVTQLFYNTPARLKHLKTIHTELANITDTMNKLALAHPEVRFELIHNEKSLLRTNGSGDFAQVLAAIYGMRTAKDSFYMEASSLDFEVKGRLVKPEITRAGRQYVYLLINGRYIRNYAIFNAVLRGYHTLLPIGRYPIAVIQITMDPTLIDVNVHPAKLEARLSKEKELCELIEKAVRETFHKQRLIPQIERKEKAEKPVSEQQRIDFSEKTPVNFASSPQTSQSSQWVKETPSTETQFQDWTKEENERASDLRDERNETFETFVSSYHQQPESQRTVEEREPSTEETPPATESLTVGEERETALPSRRMPVLYPIGQMHGTYIMAQNENGLYIIDQHAAQERIKYEFFREKVAETANEVQELLIPMTFEFSSSEVAIIETYLEELRRIGLEFEAFGHNSYIVRSHPQWFPKGKEEETIEDIVNQILEDGKVSIKELREDLAIMMSCKKSIKANRHLRQDEIQALLDQLAEAQDPFTCPHGRPVIITFTTYEMEKMFKRVM